MPSRTASCACGQLSIEVEGETLGAGVCHCFACQKRTGSVFAALAAFAAPYKVAGEASEHIRTGDRGSRARFRFCPVCGSNLFHTQEGDDEMVLVAVGCFADPDFPPPTDSLYESRKHNWVRMPPGIAAFDKDCD